MSDSPRRCLFCGRAKGDLIDPSDPKSRAVQMTREHIFRSAWKKTVEASIIPADSSLGVREMTAFGIDGKERSVRPDPLFELVVKPVCDHCNNGWLNDLDTAVEPFILEHNSDIDALSFRRWAIKIAILRSYYHDSRTPQPGDFAAIYAGDIANWRIFIGRTALPNHLHIFAGYGVFDAETGGRILGVTQVTWSLGTVFVIAMRIVDDCESGSAMVKAFKQYNRDRGIQVAEILPSAKRFPTVDLLPELSFEELDRLGWFMSTMPISPIGAKVKDFEDFCVTAMKANGTKYTEMY